MDSLVLKPELIRNILAPFSPAAVKMLSPSEEAQAMVGWGPPFRPRVAPLPAALASSAV